MLIDITPEGIRGLTLLKDMGAIDNDFVGTIKDILIWVAPGRSLEYKADFLNGLGEQHRSGNPLTHPYNEALLHQREKNFIAQHSFTVGKHYGH